MTDTPDTSPEAVETLCGLMEHNKAWQGLQKVDREAYEQATATLRALAAERDALKARAEAAEAEVARLRVVLQALPRTIQRAISKNDTGQHRIFLDGRYQTGPVVDWANEVLTELVKIARVAPQE